MGKNNSYRTVLINTISEFLDDLSSYSEKEILWFRGHANTEYRLLPGIYRKVPSLCKLKSIEDEMLDCFTARNYHLINGRLPENEMQWLCMMQHYNAATRLLDWTENALAAFMFSLEPHFKDDCFDHRILPCVWILKPEKLNRFHKLKTIPNLSSLSDESWRNYHIRQQNSKRLEQIFLTGINSCESVFFPMAVLHPYNNERIRAQAGVFTIFPIYNECPESYIRTKPCLGCPQPIIREEKKFNMCAMENLENCGSFLTKYVIMKPVKVYNELIKIGYKLSSIYPETPNTSKEVEKYILGRR